MLTKSPLPFVLTTKHNLMLTNRLFLRRIFPCPHLSEKVSLKLPILAPKLGNYYESILKLLQKKCSPFPPNKTSILCLAGWNTFSTMQDSGMKETFTSKLSMTQESKGLNTYHHWRPTWDYGSKVDCLMPMKIKGMDFRRSLQTGSKFY